MNKFKNMLKDFTDSVGLTFDDKDDDYEGLEMDNKSLDKDDIEKNHSTSKNDILHSYTNPTYNSINKNQAEQECQTIFIAPKNFTECMKIADYIKENKIVTLNLENLNVKEAQRMIDFLSGAINIKEAKWIPISNKVFTCIPKNINYYYDGNNELNNDIFLDIEEHQK